MTIEAKTKESFTTRIERISKGLVGRFGFAAQEIGSKEVIALNGK